MAKIKKNIFFNALLSLSSLVLPLFTLPYITRTLSAQGFGLVSFANSFIQYFVIVASLGIPIYGIREISKIKDDLQRRSILFFEIFFIRIVCSSVVIIIYLCIVFCVPKLNSELLFYSFGVFIILLGAFDINWFFNAMEDFQYIAIRSFVFQIISILLCFSLIRKEDDLLVYFLIPILISFFNVVINIFYAKKYINLSAALSSPIFKLEHFKSLLLLFSILFFTSIYNLIDTTILGFLSSSEYVGFYSVTSKINKVPLTFILVLAPVILPRISAEMQSGNIVEIERLIFKSLQFVVLVGVPITFGLYYGANYIMLCIAGENFIGAVESLKIASPLSLIIGLTNVFSMQLLIPFNQEKRLLYSVLFGTVCSVSMNLFLIPVFKHNGAAISSLVAEIVVLIACYSYSSSKIKIALPWRDLLLAVLLCFPFFLFFRIIEWFTTNKFIVLVLSSGLCVIFYAVAQIFVLRNIIMVEIKNVFVSKITKLILRK